ncbi:MAG: ABC transporter ATP-binding protein [Flavobacteriaceae bacterium]|nr:ABC transporter ATP-binding protein [Flavobacteriaceae bacterium]
MSIYILETEHLNYTYKSSNNSLSNLNLKVPSGSIYGFLGPNGAGKSTTIRVLVGLLKKQSGIINFFNDSFSSFNRIDVLKNVGSLIESPSLYGHLTAKENLTITAKYRQNISKDRISEIFEMVKLSKVKDKKVKEFSYGMKQRLGLAIALIGNPKLIILDEPTNGLDPKGIIEMRRLLQELNQKHGITIFISSHLLSEVELICTNIGIIKNGKMIFQGAISQLKDFKKNKVKVSLETDNLSNTIDLLGAINIHNLSIIDSKICLQLEDKNQIPFLVNHLCENGVSIYGITTDFNLEDLYLKIIEN